jgi:acetylornithine/succinyldiaminopimelate/putrescine aminotransferase
VIDEDLAGNSKRLGNLFMAGISHHKKSRLVKAIRGKGFFVALEFGNEAKPG